VIQLRQVGTDHVYPLRIPKGDLRRDPAGISMGVSLGAAPGCDLRIHDPTRRTSKLHAVLRYKDHRWNVLDVGAKHGLLVDGVRQDTACLSAGMVLGIGGVMLLAESVRSVELRDFLARVIGWAWVDDKETAVEQALQRIRTAQLQRGPIHLQSEDDLVDVAKDLHRYLFGPSAAFVMCDPRRSTTPETVRSPANWKDPHEALRAAAGGTLCFRRLRLPTDFVELVHRVRTSPEIAVQLMVCDTKGIDELFNASLVIPPLRSRPPQQIAQVIQEYFSEALAAFEVDKPPTAADRAWIAQHSAQSLSEVAKGTRRLVALQREEGIATAANVLDMAPPSLQRWLKHRGIPPGPILLAPDWHAGGDRSTRAGSRRELETA
jgi:predicted component of type VI protein secretion system